MSADGKPKTGSATMWIGVGVVFALMVMAWTAMFFFATKHRAESVPLENTGEAR